MTATATLNGSEKAAIENFETSLQDWTLTVDEDDHRKIQARLMPIIAGEVERVRSEVPQVDMDKIVQLVTAAMPKPRAQKVEIKYPDGHTVKVEGATHPEYDWAVQLAHARKNILLVGPAGCGKSHMARQIAEALTLPFYFLSCSAGMSEGQLLGRLIPIGANGSFEYVRSDFVKAYEEGGVFLLDELDAADSNVLLVLNAAIANGHMAVPNRTENPVAKRHPDFVLIGAANTFGTGADRLYVGRNQLDESTLDRFRLGQIEMNYDAFVFILFRVLDQVNAPPRPMK